MQKPCLKWQNHWSPWLFALRWNAMSLSKDWLYLGWFWDRLEVAPICYLTYSQLIAIKEPSTIVLAHYLSDFYCTDEVKVLWNTLHLFFVRVLVRSSFLTVCPFVQTFFFETADINFVKFSLKLGCHLTQKVTSRCFWGKNDFVFAPKRAKMSPKWSF